MSQEAEELLQARSHINRATYQQKIVDAAQAQEEQSSSTQYAGFDSETGLARLRDANGNIIYGNAQTNGAIALGDNIRLRRGGVVAGYDAMPRTRTESEPETKPSINYFIISLQQSEQNTFLYPFNPEFKEIEYWLTGGKYKLKKILKLGFEESEGFNLFEGGDAFIMNLGGGKFLCSTNRFELPPTFYGGAANRKYWRQQFLTQKSNKTVTELIPDIYKVNGAFGYLGNGIYQSMIEDGMGQIYDAVDDGLSIIDSQVFIQNRGTLDAYYNGFGRDIGAPSEGFPYLNRLDANILPETKNVVVLSDEIINLTGTLSINTAGIYDFDLITNGKPGSYGNNFEALKSNNYERILQSNYLINTTVDETFNPGGSGNSPILQYQVTFRDRPLFGWRNRNIEHQTWLPNGNKTFAFSSSASKSGGTYTYSETMTGELMMMSWDEKYIVHQFTDVTKVSTLNTESNPVEFSEIFTNTGNQKLTLKTYGDVDNEKDIILNSSGKFFILNKSYTDLSSNNSISLTLDTTIFRIRITKSLNYYSTFNPDLNLNAYVGENIITSQSIDGFAYLIKGLIESITQENNTIYVTISITEKKRLPTIKSSYPYHKGFSDPFYQSIVLDNGVFWNYYLSYRPDNVVVEARLSYRRFNQAGTGFNSIAPYWGNTFGDLVCDQTMPFIHNNPITVPFCSYQRVSNLFPPSNLLKVDNLVGDSIYRIDEYLFLETYIDNINKKDTRITKMPVSEWQIFSNGDIKYKKTFLVNYDLQRPFYNSTTDDVEANLISVGNSYHP